MSNYHGRCGVEFKGAYEQNPFVYQEVKGKLQIVSCLGMKDTELLLIPENTPFPEPVNASYACMFCDVKRSHVIKVVQNEINALKRLLDKCPPEITKEVKTE